MAAGYDARLGWAKETTFDTRVAPAVFLPVTAEDLGYEYNRYFSPAIGTGAWGRPSIVTTQVGSGSLSGDVTTTGFSKLLDGLHPNTVTPAQQAATAAYLHTHSLSGAPTKSFSAQVQMPPVTSATLVPHDMTGIVMGGITLSWGGAGVLSYEIPTVYRTLDLTQSLASYTPPTAYDLFSFQQGTLSIGGTPEANVLGDGNIAFAWPLRDDAFALGSNGKIAKPVPTDKPSATGTFTADFNDNTNITRVINNTVADVVLKFTGATIASTYHYEITITVPDCVFTTQRPTVGSPGPVQQTVTFTAASSTADVPSITYMTTDTTV